MFSEDENANWSLPKSLLGVIRQFGIYNLLLSNSSNGILALIAKSKRERITQSNFVPVASS